MQLQAIGLLSPTTSHLPAVKSVAEYNDLKHLQYQYHELLNEMKPNCYTVSRSTIRDADIAEVSSHYIQQQILQQASATLLATANQTPSIALQLI